MQLNQTNVSLSKYEYELVNNAQILLTKNEIIKKVYEMFGTLAERYVQKAPGIIPPEALEKPPKISRGENYEGLPYVMLDYPRHFIKDDTLAIRTFFWWGNFFSVTIQLSGTYYKMLLPHFSKFAENNLSNGWHIGVNDNKWLHHFRPSNYDMLTGSKLEWVKEKGNFLKMAKKIPLTEWDKASDFLEENFDLLLSIISY